MGDERCSLSGWSSLLLRIACFRRVKGKRSEFARTSVALRYAQMILFTMRTLPFFIMQMKAAAWVGNRGSL